MAQVCREARLLLLGLGVGIVLMVVYDGLRLFRFLVPHKNLVTGLEDLCYWIWSGFFTFLFCTGKMTGHCAFTS